MLQGHEGAEGVAEHRVALVAERRGQRVDVGRELRSG
jgi:hypothetical protein